MAKARTYRRDRLNNRIEESNRHRNEILRSKLELERSSFIPTYMDLNDFICTRRGRFFISDTNKGDRRSNKILDSTGTESADTLASSMMGGSTSPSVKWLRLTTQNPMVAQIGPVERWLYDMEMLFLTVFSRSNLYRNLPTFYLDAGIFATAAMLVEENFSGKYLQTEILPPGSYMISNNAEGMIDTIVRDFRMTVRNLIEDFGKLDPNTGEVTNWENFSEYVKGLWEKYMYEEWIDVCHVIKPNEDYDPKRSVFSKYKKYSSCYYERGYTNSQPYEMSANDDNQYLSESGYDIFPVMVLRWRTTGEDSYGTDSPGWRALPDIKQLQQGEKFELQAIEKMVKPPLVASTNMRTATVTQLPGDVTYDDTPGDQRVRAMFQLDPRIKELEYKQEQVRGRIKRIFKEDLFLMLSTANRPDMTATEVNERKEEKTLVLGPVLEQLNQELDKLIDITFDILLRQKLIPPPPRELQGQPLKVEYTSVFHSAQKMVALYGIDKFTAYCVQLGQVNPEYIDKMNGDKLIDWYGTAAGVPPGGVRTDEEVAVIRGQRQKAQQAAQMMEALKTGAGAAKDLSQADTSGQNALTAITGGAAAA